MKILMVLEHEFPPDIRVENEITALLSKGHEVQLACYTFTGEDRTETWEGCTVFKKRISSFTHKASVAALKFPYYFNFWRKFLRKLILAENPDAIHIHDLPLAKLGYEFKCKYGLHFTLDLHENWPVLLQLSQHTNTFLGRILSSNRQWIRYEKQACRYADKLIVVIEEARDRLVALGANPQKVHVVANYPELSDFKNLPKADKHISDQHILYYAGGINKHRGLQYVIAAIPKLKKQMPEFKFWIFGDGRYKEELQQQVQELHLNDTVLFFGQVSYAEVLEKLLYAHITIIPHIKSGHTDNTIPHKLFQYMYLGKPVISSNCAPIERILKDTESGAVYTYNDPDDFIQKYTDMVKDTARMKSFASNGIKAVQDRYNWDVEQNNLAAIYS